MIMESRESIKVIAAVKSSCTGSSKDLSRRQSKATRTGKMTIDAEDIPLPLASCFPKAAMASSAIEDAVSKPECIDSEIGILTRGTFKPDLSRIRHPQGTSTQSVGQSDWTT